MPVKIFVGNLNENSSSDDLRVLFEKYGEVTECDIIKNFGFVHMADKSSAETAIDALQGYEFDGYKMNVEMSTQATQGRSRARDEARGMRGDHGGRGGRGGRGRGRGGMGRGGDRFEPYSRDSGFSRRPDPFERRPLSMSDRRPLPPDPYARDPYMERDPYLRDPYARDPYARDPYARDPYARDPYPPPREPYTRDLYARDPYARDPYARDPYARDPYQRDPYPRDTLSRDPFGRPPPEYYDGARPAADTVRSLGAREENREIVRYPDPRDRLTTATSENSTSRLPQGWGNAQNSTAGRATVGLPTVPRLNGTTGGAASGITKGQTYGQVGQAWM